MTTNRLNILLGSFVAAVSLAFGAEDVPAHEDAPEVSELRQIMNLLAKDGISSFLQEGLDKNSIEVLDDTTLRVYGENRQKAYIIRISDGSVQVSEYDAKDCSHSSDIYYALEDGRVVWINGSKGVTWRAISIPAGIKKEDIKKIRESLFAKLAMIYTEISPDLRPKPATHFTIGRDGIVSITMRANVWTSDGTGRQVQGQRSWQGCSFRYRDGKWEPSGMTALRFRDGELKWDGE